MSTPKHPLDSLFKAKLRGISMRQFELFRKSVDHVPTPWRWTDNKTDIEWTLMGRKGELLWHASEAHHVKNHSAALYSIERAISHDEAWHQSKPGVPDILLFWLGTMRYGTPHPRTQSLISRALEHAAPGEGKPGDGGWLDQTIKIVEDEVKEGVSDSRKRVIHDATVGRWLRGTILRGINPGDADWRVVSSTSMPLAWPQETIERIFKLALATRTNAFSVLSGKGEGYALVQQLRESPSSTAMMEMLLEDVSVSEVRDYAPPTLLGVEYYHAQGMDIDEATLEKISVHIKPDRREEIPSLAASCDRHQINRATPGGSAHPRPSSRL